MRQASPTAKRQNHHPVTHRSPHRVIPLENLSYCSPVWRALVRHCRWSLPCPCCCCPHQGWPKYQAIPPHNRRRGRRSVSTVGTAEPSAPIRHPASFRVRAPSQPRQILRVRVPSAYTVLHAQRANPPSRLDRLDTAPNAPKPQSVLRQSVHRPSGHRFATHIPYTQPRISPSSHFYPLY